VKFDIEDFYENLSRNADLPEVAQQYRALYMRTWAGFILLAGTCSAARNIRHCCVTVAMFRYVLQC
jgi:hypothetical protein